MADDKDERMSDWMPKRLREIAQNAIDGNSRDDVLECADALEAQEERIAELEQEVESLRRSSGVQS